MEDGDTEKYHPSRVIQVFLSRKRGCIRCISLQVYIKSTDYLKLCYLWDIAMC